MGVTLVHLPRITPNIGNQLLVGLVVTRCALQLPQVLCDRNPPFPASIRITLSLDGGHILKDTEGLQHPHPPQHVGVTLVHLPRITPNIGNQLLVGFVVVLRAGGTPCEPGHDQDGKGNEEKRRGAA